MKSGNAVRVARHLGAAKIVGASRTKETLNKVEGLDERVLLTDPLEIPKSVGPIDIVLDYVGGPNNVAVMKTVDILFSTPSMLSPHNPLDYPNLKTVVVAGEACPKCTFHSYSR